MSLPGNSKEIDIVIVMLCAGEGRRMKSITSRIPKPLIKIPSNNNRTILQVNLDNLEKIRLKNIFIVTGHLGHLVQDYLNTTNKNINVIHSREEYKKGPLDSFLEIIKSQKFQDKIYEIHEEGILLVMPGDTIFEIKLFRDFIKIIDENRFTLNEHPSIAFRKLNDDENDSKIKQEFIEKKKKISIAIIENDSQSNRLINLIQLNSDKIDLRTTINQIIPIITFPISYTKKILALESFLKERTISALINKVISRGEIINAIELSSDNQFYDIDNIEDLDRLKDEE